MKMTNKHYNQLCKLMHNSLDKFPHTFQEYDEVGMNLDRYLWDVFLFARKGNDSLMKELYTYCNDNHITTALRRSIKSYK